MHGADDGAGRTSRLHLVLEERVVADGDDPVVDLAVASAEVTGEVTELELEAARRRSVRITGAGVRRKLEFPSNALGDGETIKMIDLALLGHLMAPAAPKDGERPVPDTAVDGAHIYTGWDRSALDLTGRATVAELTKVEGRRVVLLDAAHDGRTTIASGEPAVTVCSYTRLPTVSGPLTLAQRATIHRHTGLLLTSSGVGSIRFTGERSVPPAEARAVRATASTARAPIAIDLDWRFEERLIGPWPSDPGPPWQRWLAIGLLAVVVVALGTSLTVARSRLLPIRWRRRPDESDLAYVAAGWPR